MKYKKIFIFLIVFVFIVGLLGCDFSIDIAPNNDNDKKTDDTITDTPTKKEDDIYIYAVNDFHGIVYEDGDSVGLSKLFGYIYSKKQANPDNTVIISSGDMFQGSALSSMSRGELVLDAMNYIGFDSMTLGNHEFDWGIETVTRFSDGNMNNGEASFPLLGANIIDKTTGKIANGLKPYAVIERVGLKIGIIGIIGYGQESDILASYVANYKFTDELTAIKKYAKELRENEKCDIVIVSAHDDTSSINNTIANLTGSEKVDAVFNGHTHQAYYSEESRSDKSIPMPVVQSGCYGKYVGIVILTYDYVNKCVKKVSAINSKASSVCKKNDKEIDALFDKYQDYAAIANEELGQSGSTIYQSVGGYFCADSLVDKYDVDLGICNRGGIRGSGFPIKTGDIITYGDIFEIMPFENQVVIVELTGDTIIKSLFSGADNYYFISSNVDVDNKTINGVKIVSSQYYKVATIDYLYEKTSQPFMYGKNYTSTGDLFRDVIALYVKNVIKQKGKFYYSKYE